MKQLIIALAGIAFLQTNSLANEVIVPDFTGQPLEQVKRLLDQANWKFLVSTNRTCPLGKVVQYQEPAALTVVNSKEVRVILDTGNQPQSLPAIPRTEPSIDKPNRSEAFERWFDVSRLRVNRVTSGPGIVPRTTDRGTCFNRIFRYSTVPTAGTQVCPGDSVKLTTSISWYGWDCR